LRPYVFDDDDGAACDLAAGLPAVVGTAISGATRSLMRGLPPSMVA